MLGYGRKAPIRERKVTYGLQGSRPAFTPKTNPGSSYSNIPRSGNGNDQSQRTLTMYSQQDAAPFNIEQDQWIGNVNGENLFDDDQDW